MKLSEILRAGKANIERRGWGQGDEVCLMGLPDGPCCVATALPKDGPNLELSMVAIELFQKANGLDLMQGIGDWNDAPERTKEEVLAAYDKAITAAEEQEK